MLELMYHPLIFQLCSRAASSSFAFLVLVLLVWRRRLLSIPLMLLVLGLSGFGSDRL